MNIDYDVLTIDKDDGNVMYNDKLHKYWTKDEKQSCVSVTTLIHQFSTFDEDFWSKYKTLEKLISEDKFKEAKVTLLKTKRFTDSIISDYGIDKDIFDKERKLLLKDWEEKRETSCIRGSAIHKQFELGNLKGDSECIKKLNLGGKFKPNSTNRIVPGAKGMYPELLLSRISDDKILRVAGQADLVIIDGFDVFIIDYKTSKKIDTKAYFDTRTRKKVTMKYPLNNIEDSNFWHYSLQLSTYAWMIEKIDPRFNIKLLLIVHIDHDNNVTDYECPYLKSDVEKMLAFHKKQIKHDIFYNSLKKIEF